MQSRGAVRAQPAGPSTISATSRSSRSAHMPRAAAADPLPELSTSSPPLLPAPWLQRVNPTGSEDTGQHVMGFCRRAGTCPGSALCADASACLLSALLSLL